ncbi:hypothetical protein GGR26_001439 [Lewinella marina]|uniref:Uncharacterized protein n=1 Tax=Neolewinella marina TaxID=438751 RepID=A0A2G0CF74_9BACT|nr:hypothetical protein [Neolewinella marina]NJB85694.1 hypothetical protein [Neolewinella marina]PHK98626.1 hypothetical protein CGL56_09145 [Neolewinella marina]
MTHPKVKLITIVLALFICSAACSGFLVGRTVKLQKEGKFEQIQQVSDQAFDFGTVVWRGAEVIRRVILR